MRIFPKYLVNSRCKIKFHLVSIHFEMSIFKKYSLLHSFLKYFLYLSRSVIDTKESDGIADPMEKIAIKSHSNHSDSGIGIMLILIH